LPDSASGCSRQADGLVISAFTPREQGFSSGFAIALPILYGGMGFLATAIGCAAYNAVAGWVGGIEVELDGERPAGS